MCDSRNKVQQNMMLHNTLTVRVLSFRARIIAIKFSNVFPPLASIVNAYARSKTWISVTTNPVNNGMIKYSCPASDQHQLVPDIPWCSTWRTTLAGQAHTDQDHWGGGSEQTLLCLTHLIIRMQHHSKKLQLFNLMVIRGIHLTPIINLDLGRIEIGNFMLMN